MRRALLLALLLGACAAKAPLPDVAIPLRNPTAPVASQSDVTEARLGGDWVVVEGGGIAPGTRLRFSSGRIAVDGVTMPFEAQGQGRFMLAGRRIWVHWLDADNRTAALGDPDGKRVWIMDRTGRPGERLGAAQEILRWYGYDLARLNRG